MTMAIQESVKMLEMLPESEQQFASEFIRRLVLAWDSDFTKLTSEQRMEDKNVNKMCRRKGSSCMVRNGN